MQEHERYITVQEAAARLSRSEPEICRMLETGMLPALLRGELSSMDGTPIGFDFALLPPELVARVFDQGGDDLRVKWKYCGGHGKAICIVARQSSIRVLWEPSLFPELMPHSKYGTQAGVGVETEAQTQAGETAPTAPPEAVLMPPQAVPAGSELANCLTTPQVATVFDGLLFTAENWPKRLSDAKWLHAARLSAGEQGGLSALWCPLALALAIHARKKDVEEKAAILKKLNFLFKQKELLAQHHAAWREYSQLMSND